MNRVLSARCVCPSFLDTKVTLRAGGVDEKGKVVSVAVGSPRYMRETTPLDATRGDGVDPVIRELLFSAQDVSGPVEGDRDGAAGAISVRTRMFRERQEQRCKPVQ